MRISFVCYHTCEQTLQQIGIEQINQHIYIKMNLNKSTFRSNLRGTTPMKNIQSQSELIDNTLTKSYMFHMAVKGKSKLKEPTEQVEKYDDFLRKSHLNNYKRKKIFSSVIKSHIKTTKFKLLMSNINEMGNKFSCYCMNQVRQPVVVYLNQFKQIVIKNSNQSETLYNFNFNTIEAKADTIQMETSAFVLNINPKISLKFENEERDQKNTVQQLKKSLDSMISASTGFHYHMQDLKSKQGFEKRKYKSCIEFAEHCQTGDILLFQGQQFFAKLQRFITGSDYDHVGMVYKDPVHGILIFQSNSFNGICLSPWEYVLKYKWYSFIERIVWRKLTGVQRTDEFIEKVQDIIIEKLGKAYHISFDKLISNESAIYVRSSQKNSHKNNAQNGSVIKQIKQQEHPTIQNKQSLQSIDQKDKKQQVGYFCSELIAKVYKQLNLITTDRNSKDYKPSCNFYPLHFTQKFGLNLLKGELSDQYIIHFHPQEIQDYYNFDE